MSEVNLKTLNTVLTSAGAEVLAVYKDTISGDTLLYRAAPVPLFVADLELDVIDSKWYKTYDDNVCYLHIVYTEDSKIAHKLILFKYVDGEWTSVDITPSTIQSRHFTCIVINTCDLVLYWYGPKELTASTKDPATYDTIPAAPYDGGYSGVYCTDSDKLLHDNQVWLYSYTGGSWIKLYDSLPLILTDTTELRYIQNFSTNIVSVCNKSTGVYDKFLVYAPVVSLTPKAVDTYSITVSYECFPISFDSSAVAHLLGVPATVELEFVMSAHLDSMTGIAEALLILNTRNMSQIVYNSGDYLSCASAAITPDNTEAEVSDIEIDHRLLSMDDIEYGKYYYKSDGEGMYTQYEDPYGYLAYYGKSSNDCFSEVSTQAEIRKSVLYDSDLLYDSGGAHYILRYSITDLVQQLISYAGCTVHRYKEQYDETPVYIPLVDTVLGDKECYLFKRHNQLAARVPREDISNAVLHSSPDFNKSSVFVSESNKTVLVFDEGILYFMDLRKITE